jgi:hypothetical protein
VLVPFPAIAPDAASGVGALASSVSDSGGVVIPVRSVAAVDIDYLFLCLACFFILPPPKIEKLGFEREAQAATHCCDFIGVERVLQMKVSFAWKELLLFFYVFA